ncbi:MAG: cyclophilin family peptidyl-prolyl cis-trans isomerase [Flavobacteriales bacterium]|jgi:cyclophilin family peptidyl-prolyl cis-trans isomerase
MKRVSLLLLLALTVASCQNEYPDLPNGVYAEISTNKGTFVAKLYNEATPLTVANFVSLAEGTNLMVDDKYKGKKFFDSIIFHRVIKDFMIQGGDPTGTGSGNPGYKFPDEIVPALVHDKKGILSMANSGPGTNGSQFFVTLKETPWLNGKHTVFGEVVKGIEIVDAIGAVSVQSPANKPLEDIMIKTVNIINKGGQKITSFTDAMTKVEEENKAKEAALSKFSEGMKNKFDSLKEGAQTLPSGLQIHIDSKGDGQRPVEGVKVLVNYAGYLATNGILFDTNRVLVARDYSAINPQREAQNGYAPTPMSFSKDAQLNPGFLEALLTMSVGDKITAFIPAHLGYGERGAGNVIPPNSDLVFEIEITGLQE